MEWVIFYGLNVEDRQYLYPLVGKEMTILDIGTNIGETLLHFASRAGTNGCVYGFEPVEYNFEKCKSNIQLNGFSNVKVFPYALSDKNETLYFTSSSNQNSGGIYMMKDSAPQSYPVTAMTLDAFIAAENITKIDLIKMDVEGFETNVLIGGMESIRKFEPVLFIEVDRDNLQRQNSSPEELNSIQADAKEEAH
jgi:FkbM family methyltransferase